jgi:ADP-ribose pyrophosphatase
MQRDLEPWKLLRPEPVLAVPPWFVVEKQTLELPGGRIVEDYYRIDQRDFVSIVPVRADGLILGLWHYKHGPKRINLGVPAGVIEHGEAPLAAGQRELAEECALVASRWQALGSFCMDGNRSGQQCHLFVARDCETTTPGDSDDLEEARLVWLTREEWRQHLDRGDVATAGAALAVMRYLSL